MKKNLFLIAVAALTSAVLAEAGGWEFTEVTAVQRWPWSRKVDIDFHARQTDGQVSRRRAARVAVKLGDRTLAADQLQGASILGEGRHRIVWTPPEDGSFPSEIKNAAFTVSLAEDVPDVGYMTVDLASGAIDYKPLAFSNDVNVATYKTTHMAFRYIPSTQAGEWRAQKGKATFRIGSDGKRTDLGIADGDRNREGVAEIALTKAFFLGVFPMTRSQYALLGGSVSTPDAVPVRNVTYDGLRGTDGTNDLGLCCFPATRNIGLDTPIGRLRLRTGRNFDFPTEAQWEYAARAGSEEEYFAAAASKSAAETLLNEYGAYNASAAVGTRKPNAWGLYDLIGCCHQWTTTSPVLGSNGGPAKHADGVDPIGPAPQMGAGPFRVCKGSHCNPGDAKARVGRLAYRLLQRSNCQNGMLNGTSYNAEQSNTGCRLALTLDVK